MVLQAGIFHTTNAYGSFDLVRPNSLHRKGELILLPGIVLAGFLLRVIGLQPFAITHWDEGALWSGAQWFLSFGAAGDYMSRYSPPLPPLLFALSARVFGSGFQGAIWISATVGTASIVLIYWLGKDLLSSAAGIAAASMLALSGLNVMYSRSLLTEPFYVFFLLSTLLASVRYLRNPSTPMALFPGLAAACLQFTKYNGALAAVPLLAVLALDVATVRDPLIRRRSAMHFLLVSAIVSSAVLLNIAALWITGNLADFRRHYSHYVGQPSLGPLAVARYLGLVTPIVVSCCAVAGLIYVCLRRRSASWAIVHVGLLLYVAFLFGYTFYLRLLAPISVFLILYAAAAVHMLTESLPARWHVPSLAIVTLVFFLSSWRSLPRFLQRDHSGYNRASIFLNGVPPSMPVLMATQQYVWTDLHRPQIFIPGTSAPIIRSSTAGATKALLVVDVHAYYKYEPRVIAKFLDGLGQDHEIRTISNSLNLDCVENSLTYEELQRLDSDPDLKRAVFSIRIFSLDRDDVERLAKSLPGQGW